MGLLSVVNDQQSNKGGTTRAFRPPAGSHEVNLINITAVDTYEDGNPVLFTWGQGQHSVPALRIMCEFRMIDDPESPEQPRSFSVFPGQSGSLLLPLAADEDLPDEQGNNQRKRSEIAWGQLRSLINVLNHVDSGEIIDDVDTAFEDVMADINGRGEGEFAILLVEARNKTEKDRNGNNIERTYVYAQERLD